MATGTSNDVHQQRHCHHHRIHCYIIITWITIVLYLYHHFRHHCHPCHLGETDLKYIGAEAELWKLILFATMLSLNCYTNTNKIQLDICIKTQHWKLIYCLLRCFPWKQAEIPANFIGIVVNANEWKICFWDRIDCTVYAQSL